MAEAGLEAADEAMSRMSVSRWSDVHQDWTGYDYAVSGAGPRRWRLSSGFELRVEVVAALPAALRVEIGGRRLPVVPLAKLLDDDPDVAELAARGGGAAPGVP